MVRAGKERASAPEQHDAPETVQDARWINGINRQLRPDAPSHQRVASEAAAAKRERKHMKALAKANAMREEIEAAAASSRVAFGYIVVTVRTHS